MEQNDKTYEWISSTDDILEIGFKHYNIYWTEWELDRFSLQYK